MRIVMRGTCRGTSRKEDTKGKEKEKNKTRKILKKKAVRSESDKKMSEKNRGQKRNPSTDSEEKE